MKCLLKGSIIALIISISVAVVGALLQGFTFSGNFDIFVLSDLMLNLGFIATVITGIMVVVVAIFNAIAKDKSAE
jgi:cation transporter-like permease